MAPLTHRAHNLPLTGRDDDTREVRPKRDGPSGQVFHADAALPALLLLLLRTPAAAKECGDAQAARGAHTAIVA